jgi:Glu-tRNA(Gln) amidotransferase subunit E-like FAD-binding protein
LSKIKVPETWEQKAKRFRKILPKEMIDQILKSEYLDLFEKFSKKYNPVLVANTFTSTVKDLSRQGLETEFTEEQFENVFSSVKNKIISKEAILDILEIVAKKKVPVKDAIKKSGLKGMTEDELRKIIKDILKKHHDLVEQKRFSPLMGEVMKEVRGRISGKTVAKILNQELK